jgi:hypothetical protein
MLRCIKAEGGFITFDNNRLIDHRKTSQKRKLQDGSHIFEVYWSSVMIHFSVIVGYATKNYTKNNSFYQ